MNKTNLYGMMILLWGFTCTTAAYAQENWELQKEEDGIKVYTSPVEGSGIKAFKAETVMEGDLSSFVAILKDVEAFPELYSSNSYTELIEQTDTFQLQYSRTKLPWPLTDRDGVYANSFRQHYGHKTVTITVDAVSDIRPEDEGFVRISEATGFWMLHPLGDQTVEITYQMHAEPGGSLPSWVINMFLVDSPVKDLKSLRERVKMEKYANRKFDFLIEY